MEISEDSCPPVQRYDHDYYGNCATVNGYVNWIIFFVEKY